MRKASRWFPAAAGVGALAVAAGTERGRGQRLDRRLYRALNGRGGPGADWFFKQITEYGSIWASVGASAALSWRGKRREAFDALGSAAATWALGQVLKQIFDRPRPYHALDNVRLLIDEPRGTSWPSSHPAVLLTFLTVITRNLDARWPVKGVAAGLAWTVGLSRIYLGVHYPADVVGGLMLGRGVADLWSAAVSPRTLGRLPLVSVPGTVRPR